MASGHEQLTRCVTWSLWMGAQVGLLAVLAARVPLAAKFPEPVENAAAMAIVCTQLILAAAMAPALLAGRQALGAAIAGAVPMIVLATLLSGQPALRAIAPIGLTCLWLGVFACCGQLREVALRTGGQAILLLLTAGAPLLLYLCWEFGIRPVRHDGVMALLSPTLGAASLCLPGASNWWVFLVPVLVLLAFLAKVWRGSSRASTASSEKISE